MIAMEQEVMEAINGWTYSLQAVQADADRLEEEEEEEKEKESRWRSFITIICGETGEFELE